MLPGRWAGLWASIPGERPSIARRSLSTLACGSQVSPSGGLALPTGLQVFPAFRAMSPPQLTAVANSGQMFPDLVLLPAWPSEEVQERSGCSAAIFSMSLSGLFKANFLCCYHPVIMLIIVIISLPADGCIAFQNILRQRSLRSEMFPFRLRAGRL